MLQTVPKIRSSLPGRNMGDLPDSATVVKRLPLYDNRPLIRNLGFAAVVVLLLAQVREGFAERMRWGQVEVLDHRFAV
jgi:hypothetical protein